jgi:hypothetical protein
MARQRLTNVIGSSGARQPATQMPKTLNELQHLLVSLRSRGPGPWSVNVSELARHFTSAVFVAVNTLMTHAGRSTFKMVERTTDPSIPNGEVELPWDDPLHELIETPNPEDTLSDYIEQTVQQRSLTGMACTWVVPGSGGKPAEFYSLPTSNLWPVPPGVYNGNHFAHGAYRAIPYTYGMLSPSPHATAAGALIPAEQVMRLKNHHPYLRYDAYAVLTAMGHHVDTFEAVATSRAATMRQGAEQTLQLEAVDQSAGNLDPEGLKLLRKQLEILYAGPENAGKMVIAPAGWKFGRLSTTPADMAWTEGFSQLLDFLLASFGVPKAVAGLQDSSSYATLYASLRAFGYFSLGPLLGKIEARINKDMIHPAYGREFCLRLKPPEFRDEQLEVNQLSNDLKAGAIKIKEYRARRGWDAIDEPWVEDRATANFVPQPPPGAEGQEQDPLAAMLGGGDGGKENAPLSGEQTNDPMADNARPAVQKSAVNRIARLERLFEKAKTNGHAFPLKGDVK